MTSNRGREETQSGIEPEAVPCEQDPVLIDLIQALDTVPDPCCVLSGKDLSILDLGLINRMDRHGDTIEVGITLTDTMCEFADRIFSDIEALADRLPGITTVNVVPEVVPVWSSERLSDRAVDMIKTDAGQFFSNWDMEKARADAGD